MLNHSISQLKQIKILNISPNKEKRQHSPTIPATQTRVRYNSTPEDDVRTNVRPSPIKRRSTRYNLSGEHSASRIQRFEAAITRRTYESFVVLYDARETIYISEQQCSQNPSFLPLEIDCRSTSLQMAVYVKPQDKDNDHRWLLLMRVDVPLGQLVAVDKHHRSNTSNTLLVQFEDETWYATATELAADQGQSVPKAQGYTYNQVMRLQNSTEVINDALQSITGLKDEMEKRLREAYVRIQSARNLNMMHQRLLEIKDASRMLLKQTKSDQNRIRKIKEDNALRASLLTTSRAHKESVVTDLYESRAKQAERLPALEVLSSEIRRLQRQLTTTLTQIYPIIVSNGGSSIRGLRTAKNSDYWMQDHEQSAALGHIAHFISLLSRYLAIPLRYPVRPISSHSYVYDPISIMPENSDVRGGPPYSLKGDDRYPLFFERGGVERLQWGVFLLNKNIEQLLQGRGLVCGDLRQSLQNLDGLVVWLVSVTEDEDKSLYPTSTMPANHRSQEDMAEDSREDSIAAANARTVEIIDHEDLLAAQLRTRIKGKRRLTLLSEKDEREDTDMAPASNHTIEHDITTPVNGK